MSDKPSTAFEHQIERIHKLLEGEAAKVTWNDKIPDPDNPDQLRQIDITIQRGEVTIHAECRIHQSPQDVKWIEELIGRRASLGADAIIAVSSSGFTVGAIRKASAFNIHLRTLGTLSDDEVRLWSNIALPVLIYYEFTECRLVLETPCRYLSTPLSITSEDARPIEWRGIFEPVMSQLDNDNELDHATKTFYVEIFSPLLLNGQKPSKMQLNGIVRRIKQPVPLDSVLGYFNTGDANVLAQVQKHSDGLVEIIQSSDSVAFVSDNTNMVVPPNSFFHCVWFDFKRPVSVEWAHIVSPHRAIQSDVKLAIALKYSPANSCSSDNEQEQ
jgi:hypothetical protein